MTRRPSPEEIKAAADRAEASARGDAAKDFVAESLSEGELNAEIAKLAAMPIGVYESSRVENAKRLRLRASVLDALVETKRGKTTKKPANSFLPHWNVEPWHEPVDGATLLAELRDHFKSYVVLPNKHGVIVIPLWVLHTWVFDVFDITPYLAITSPTRRCGKTLLMTMLYWLCSRAKKNDSMSKAAIYRSVEAERPTLVLDEVSWVLDLKDERQGILCGGFERLGHVEICDGEGANIATKRYGTYCPKAFGLIGKLTATLMDRSIEIAMQRKLNEKVERLRRRDNERHAELRRKCLRWANDNRAKLATITPKLPEGLNDRAIDAWEPLFAIAECVGGDWPKLTIEAALALSGGESASEERGVELLHDIEAEFDSGGRPAITTKTLIAGLCSDEERPWATYAVGKAITPKQLGALLRPFNIISDTVHPNETGEAKAKGYRRVRFEDAFDRYLTTTKGGENAAMVQNEASQACKRASANETGITGDFSIRAETNPHAYEKCEKPANDGDLHGRTDKNSKPEPARHSGHSNGGARAFRSDVEDAAEELALRKAGRCCAHCGRPGGQQWDWRGAAIRLHRECREDWVSNQYNRRAS